MGTLRAIAKSVLPRGRKLRRIKGGLIKGMMMELDFSSQSQRYLGLDERELLASMRKLIPRCSSLIDVGANDGYYTLAFLRSQAKRVIACEPGRAMNRLL